MGDLNGNGAGAGTPMPLQGTQLTITDAILAHANNGVKDQADRQRRNLVRRIRRAIRKDGMDLHHHGGEYYPVSVHRWAAIDIVQFGRKVGAIQPVGICVCKGWTWHHVDGVDLCDVCVKEVRSC